MVVKYGTSGAVVQTLQDALNKNGYSLVVDGDFGKKTETALKQYQEKQLISPTGTLCSETAAILFPDILPCATVNFLARGQYKHSTTEKIGVCLHHTAGSANVANLKSVWERDKRGRVATHFGIGGDGKIHQFLPLQCWAYHIAMGRVGLSSSNDMINGGYIGIEICNYGYVTEKNGTYFNYVGGVMRPEEVVELEKPFGGHKLWHRYTDAQVVAVRVLLKQLQEKYGFEYENLPLDATWFDIDPNAQQGKRVLTTHTNFEGVGMKLDCSPQPNFFEMIKP